MGGSCISSGAQKVLEKMKEEVRHLNPGSGVEVKAVGCMGACAKGPLVKSRPTT